MRRSNKFKLKMAALVLAGLPIGAACAAEGSDWNWSITPYAWLPSINTSLHVNVPPFSGDTTTKFSDVVSKINFALPLHLEGQGDDFGIMSDISYLSLSQKHSGRFFDTDASQKIGAFELAGVWSPGPNRHEGFEAFAGLRYLWFKFDVMIDPVHTSLPSADIGIHKNFADLMLGGRYTTEFNDRWGVELRTDGSWGSTDGVYGASAMFHYKTGNGAWQLGYRYMRQQFGVTNRDVNIDMYGPEVAYAFRF